jgi:hypothetical protein
MCRIRWHPPKYKGRNSKGLRPILNRCAKGLTGVSGAQRYQHPVAKNGSGADHQFLAGPDRHLLVQFVALFQLVHGQAPLQAFGGPFAGNLTADRPSVAGAGEYGIPGDKTGLTSIVRALVFPLAAIVLVRFDDQSAPVRNPALGLR